MVDPEKPPEEMFGKIMSWSDSLMLMGFELCTTIPEREIAEIKQSIGKREQNPRDVKLRLARE